MQLRKVEVGDEDAEGKGSTFWGDGTTRRDKSTLGTAWFEDLPISSHWGAVSSVVKASNVHTTGVT